MLSAAKHLAVSRSTPRSFAALRMTGFVSHLSSLVFLRVLRASAVNLPRGPNGYRKGPGLVLVLAGDSPVSRVSFCPAVSSHVQQCPALSRMWENEKRTQSVTAPP